ncbi:MAG: carbohydrate ABC transporter permease, partial [Dehalococcoidia bacterium]
MADVTEALPARAVGWAARVRASIWQRREGFVPVFFLIPALGIFAAFYAWPAIGTISGSFFRWDLLNPFDLLNPGEHDFVGLNNYFDLFGSERFRNAAVNTAIWLVVFPIATTALGLFLAVLIYEISLGATAFRSIFFLPMTISLAATGVIWTFMYDPDFGTLTSIVEALHLDSQVDAGPVEFTLSRWLSNPGSIDLGITQIRLINLSLVLPAVWLWTGFSVIIFTAGLMGIPKELIESTQVEGASGWQRFRYIMLPLLRGPLTIVGIIAVIFALRVF